MKTKFNINRLKVRTKCNISQTTIDHGHLYYISIIITRPRRGQMSRSSNLLDINLILLKHQHQNRSSDEPSGGPGEDSLAGLRVHGLPNISSSRCMENVYFWMMWTKTNVMQGAWENLGQEKSQIWQKQKWMLCREEEKEGGVDIKKILARIEKENKEQVKI